MDQYVKCIECTEREVRKPFNVVYCNRSGMVIENPNTDKIYLIGCQKGEKKHD